VAGWQSYPQCNGLVSHKIWIDVLTPKQILFFKPLVELLKERGCSILATSRRYRELEPLARMHGLDLQYVGERGGKSLKEQLAATIERAKSILPIVDDFMPDVAVSVASPVCARVAFGLGVRHVAVNDSPHSVVVGKLALPLSQRLLTPWIIPYSAWARFGLTRREIRRYRALDPAAWLKRESKPGPVPPLNPQRKTITVRLEETHAPYMKDKDMDWADAVLQTLEGSFADCNVVVLCRYGDQLDAVRAKYGSRFTVPEYVVDGRALLELTDLFIGMGGTMTTESAMMGVPTISMFQGDLYTERYLSSAGLLTKTHSLKSMVAHARRFLSGNYKNRLRKRARSLLDWMEDPVPIIASELLNGPENEGRTSIPN
jgi:predicted glycosyltransferase